MDVRLRTAGAFKHGGIYTSLLLGSTIAARWVHRIAADFALSASSARLFRSDDGCRSFRSRLHAFALLLAPGIFRHLRHESVDIEDVAIGLVK